MAAKFEIRSPKTGEFRWVLVSQGRTLATSEAYPRRGSAEKAIDSFRLAAIGAPVIDTTVPAAKTPTRKAARAVGRAVGKAVVKGGRAVEKVEKAAAKAPVAATSTAKRAAKTVEKATKKAAKVVQPTRTAKKTAAPRKRTSGGG
jgi:uncharacterized protein YegP (UPF0339 family)